MESIRSLFQEQSNSLFQAQQLQLSTVFKDFEERQAATISRIEDKVQGQSDKTDRLEEQIREIQDRLSRVEARPSGPQPGPDCKNTLVFGGWANGTRRAVLLQQLEQGLRSLNLWDLLDNHLFCTGARRSVALCLVRSWLETAEFRLTSCQGACFRTSARIMKL